MEQDPTQRLDPHRTPSSKRRAGLSEGEQFGRYMVLERVGAGGMGVVYAAYDPTLDRRVALKVLSRAGDGDAGNQRLLREAQAMARLNHPHVVTVHEAGEVNGRAFVAMEYLSGGDLTDWLHQSERTWEEIRSVFVASGLGLAAAHGAGLIHRDFKPANVMFGDDGRVRVTDFGLARLADDESEDGLESTSPRSSSSSTTGSTPLSSPLTREGLVLGTPAYMAPEQILTGRADMKTDQFAFAVSLWEALTGSRPFDGRSGFEKMIEFAVSYEPPAIPTDRRAPVRAYHAIRKAMDRNPAERFTSMTDFIAELRRDSVARRWRTAVAVSSLLALTVVASVGWNYWSQRQALCSGAQDATRAVWNPDRRSELAEAVATAGATSSAAVGAFLDDHLATWRRVYTEACTASRLRGERSPELLDLQMVCLDRRLAETDHLVKILIAGPPERSRAAWDAVVQLHSPEQCGTVEWMIGQLPLPEDPEVRAAIDHVVETLATGEAHFAAGDFSRALTHFEAAAEAAASIDYPPLEAEALVAAGFQHLLDEREAEAEDTLLRALSTAERGRYELAAASAAANLIWLDGYLRQDIGRARHWRDLAAAKLEAVDPTGIQRASYLSPWTSVLIQAGRYQEAKEVATEALRLQLAADPTGYDAAVTYGSFGEVLSSVGAYDQAITAYDHAVQLKTEIYGPDHPTLAPTLASLSQAALEVGDEERAIEAARRSIAIIEATWGPGAAQLAVPLNNLATAYTRSDRLGEADTALRRSIAIVESTSGTDDPQLFYTWLNVSSLEYRRESLDRALDAGQRAAAIAVATWGTDHPHYAYAANNIGVYLTKLGRAPEAIPLLEQALAIREAESVDPLVREVTRFNLGRARYEAGHRSAGRRLVAQARDAVHPIGGRASEDLAAFEAWLHDHPPDPAEGD